MSGGARSVELALCLCDITFQAMIQVDLYIYKYFNLILMRFQP